MPHSNDQFAQSISANIDDLSDCMRGSFLLNPSYTPSFDHKLFAEPLQNALKIDKLDFLFKMYKDYDHNLRV